jgi:ribosomal subunit interface protein
MNLTKGRIMSVSINYQNLSRSEWVDQYLERHLNKLERYLSRSGEMAVNLKYNNKSCVVSLTIHDKLGNLNFSAATGSFLESMSEVIERAKRVLSDRKRQWSDRINKRYYSIKKIPLL